METKNKEQKICNVCHLGIDETKGFARFTHFKDKDNILSEAFYHVPCFREKMLGKGELDKLKKQADEMYGFVKKTLGMPEVVNI